MTLALLFPGQGSQYVGMGKALADAEPKAAHVFEEADDVLGLPLRRIMWEGPAETLTETRHGQLAILVHSVAVLRVLGDALGRPAFAAGHSLGEFSAHVAAGTLPFADALRAVRVRSELMFAAGEERPGAMAAVLGLEADQVEVACAGVEKGVCVLANYNADHQIVLSGDREAVEEGMARARDAGAKKVVPLKVSGAFHSPLMAPAEDGLRQELDGMEFSDPDFPVIANVTADPVETGARARELLVLQLTGPVRWADSIRTMLDAGVDHFAELGPGRVLCGLNRRNAKGVHCTAVGEPADLEALGAGA